jgi:hypothetical protein
MACGEDDFGAANEGTAVRRTVPKSKLHRTTVTGSDLHYPGSLIVHPQLLEAADILEHEEVAVVDVDNGQRLETYVIAAAEPGGRGSSWSTARPLAWSSAATASSSSRTRATTPTSCARTSPGSATSTRGTRSWRSTTGRPRSRRHASPRALTPPSADTHGDIAQPAGEVGE